MIGEPQRVGDLKQLLGGRRRQPLAPNDHDLLARLAQQSGQLAPGVAGELRGQLSHERLLISGGVAHHQLGVRI